MLLGLRVRQVHGDKAAAALAILSFDTVECGLKCL